MTLVDLDAHQARWLSILAASALRRDRERTPDSAFPADSAVLMIRDNHQGAWRKLQPACQWDDE